MACPPPNKCFQVLTNDELKAKMEDLENQNSVNSEKRADKAFRQFLSESGSKSVEYHLFEEEELDNWLSTRRREQIRHLDNFCQNLGQNQWNITCLKKKN